MIKQRLYTRLPNGKYEVTLIEELTPKELFFRLNSYRVINQQIISNLGQVKMKKASITKILSEVRQEIESEYKEIPKIEESQKETADHINDISTAFEGDPKFEELEKAFEDAQKKRKDTQG